MPDADQLPDLSRDFFTLTWAEVARVLKAADAAKYRAPRNANGSRARYYWARLQRQTEKDTAK